MLLLVAAEAAHGARWRRPATVALIAVTAFALAVNVVHIQHAKRFLLAYSANVRPTLAMVELAGPAAKPRFQPATDAPRASPHHIGVSASTYLLGAAKWGSIAAPLGEVRRAPPVVRDRADVVLARALGVAPVPAGPRAAARSCVTMGATGGTATTTVRLPRRGASLRTTARADVSLRRFGPSFAARVGALRAGPPMILELAPDRAPDPWYASVSATRVDVCPVPPRPAGPARFCEVQRRLRALRARRPEEARGLFAELRQAAPPAIRRDLSTVLGGSLAGRERSAAVRGAQRRIDAFTARTCRP